MGEKDLCERELESYGDVFADILNVLLFDGKNVVDPSCLEDRASRSTYLAGDGGVRGMERDVCKRWKMGDIRIACVGLENQSNKDHDMPLRVLAYEGTEYREQLLKENEGKPRYPVIMLVLHFGEKRWCGPVCLKDVVNIPTELDPWVQDYKVNVINVAWLPPEVVARFRGDFHFVADYLTQDRETGVYKPDDRVLDHPESTYRMLAAVSGDSRFVDAILEAKNNGSGGMDMSRSSDFLDSIEARGEKRGEARGEARGVKMGIRQAVEGMLREGLSLSIIERVSAVSEDDIRKIASSIGVSVVG